MIVHEFPKAFLFLVDYNVDHKACWWKKILKVQNYIDPIGLILMLVCYAGFSKPFMFHVRDRKKNLCMGILGFFTLFLIFFLSVAVLKYQYGLERLGVTQEGYYAISCQLFWIYTTVFSGTMILVNLFPVSVFDMGLLVAGSSARNYLRMLSRDTYVKIIMMLCIVVGMLRSIVFYLIELLLTA